MLDKKTETSTQNLTFSQQKAPMRKMIAGVIGNLQQME